MRHGVQGRQAATNKRTPSRLRPAGLACLGGLLVGVLLWPALLHARFLDEAQTLRFNGRVYNRTAMGRRERGREYPSPDAV